MRGYNICMSQNHAQYPLEAGVLFEIAQGDLTQEPVDAIVNAANTTLQHGGGVALAIARAGGPVVQQQSDDWVREHGPITHETPAHTEAGKMPCRWVIHAVGPVWGEDPPEAADRKLAEAVRGSLRRAEELALGSIALPAISTGIYGYPKARAADVIVRAIRDTFTGKAGESTPLRLVRLVLWDDASLQVFLQAAAPVFGPLDADAGGQP
jgi:O-acetyl-ADP-ribose deacetylase